MYEIWDWHLIKHINHSMYLDVGGVHCSNQCCTTRTRQRLGWHMTRRLGKNSGKTLEDSGQTRQIGKKLKYGAFKAHNRD